MTALKNPKSSFLKYFAVDPLCTLYNTFVSQDTQCWANKIDVRVSLSLTQLLNRTSLHYVQPMSLARSECPDHKFDNELSLIIYGSRRCSYER